MTASAPTPSVPGLTGFTVLARGGYATVYRAVQESVGRDVAVKVENRTLETERDRRRFLREARAAGRMSSHPHVVDLFDAGVTEVGHPYLIMELCDGSYADRMRNAPLTAAEAREVGFKIADALADAHSLGVLHRDVKPGNILFSRFGEPALADFGLAILAEWRDVSITLDVLTPAYAPPETFRHAPPAASADVYALCATLYALMRGRPPRWRQDQMPSLLSLVDMFNEQIPDLPGCPDDLMAILRAGMANDEAARPSAVQLRDQLIGLRLESAQQAIVPPPEPGYTPPVPSVPPVRDRILASPFMSGVDPEQTVPHSVLEDGPPVAPPVDPFVPKPPAETSPMAGRWRLAIAVAGVVVVVAALVAVGIVYGGGGGTPDPTPGPSHTGLAGLPSVPCGFNVPAAAHCSSVVECYDADHRSVPCTGRHTWELFAFGDLPKGSAVRDPKESPVGEVCSRNTLILVDIGAGSWGRIDVILPSLADQATGPTTFRCLAGKGDGALTGQQLRKK